MALSNAERQRRFRQRKAQAVTPDDVVRAARLMYEQFLAENSHEKLPPFDEWAAGLSGKRAKHWTEFVPDDPTPELYEDFAAEDAALLLRVASVVRAVRKPPPE